MRRLAVSIAVSLALLQPTPLSAAGMFKDVADSHPFKAEIESLGRAGIIKGNPDGTYAAERGVNRAEFLKLLYLATERTPRAIHTACFPDVEKGSWYETFVCDAAAAENAFVQGYSDGKFRPGNPVSRVEAMKMVFTVFGFPLDGVEDHTRELIKYSDLSLSAWYSKYLAGAFTLGILPIHEYTGTSFLPGQAMSRGEAAAYIFQAQQALDRLNEESAASAASAASEEEVVQQESSSSESQYRSKNVEPLFGDEDQFSGTKPMSYLFETIPSKTLLAIDVQLHESIAADVSCRLYLLDQDGFSTEYYLGMQENVRCALRVALRPGKYQLQLQPTTKDAFYSVKSELFVGDGNDGFMEATELPKTLVKSGTLEIGDLSDWYQFSVAGTNPIEATVHLAASETTNCIIYMPKEADQFGFVGPQCGKSYKYSPGTYYIGVQRRKASGARGGVTYSVQWK